MARLAERNDIIEAYGHIAAPGFEPRATPAEYDTYGSHSGLGSKEA